VLLTGCAEAVPDDPSADTLDTGNKSTPTGNGTVEARYSNVGQSVSMLIVGPDGDIMLVDTGHYNDDGECVLEYLQVYNIARIERLGTSHNDTNHIGGNAESLRTTRRKLTASAPSVTQKSQRADKPTLGTSKPSKPTT
jgi:competence protein ComEC